MAITTEERIIIEQFLSRALRDVSRPNPYHLKAGIRILLATDIKTFEQICSV